MPTDREQHRTAALPLQTELGERVIATARSLRPEQWDGPTNCPPWIVKTIVAHLVRNAEMFNVMLDTGLSGGQTFHDTAEREERQKELAAMPSETLTSTFEVSHANLRDRLSRLTSSDLEQPCPHPRWLMPAWWVVDQRVVELAFHSWDMDTSIGREAEIDSRVAQFMLPAILENNLPLFHRPSPAHGRTWAIRASDMDRGKWLIQSSENDARISREDGEADVSISGDAAALVRWLYGRADIPALESAGRIDIQGKPDGMAAWRKTFPSP